MTSSALAKELSSLARFDTQGVIDALQRRRYNRRQDTKANARFYQTGILACVETLQGRGVAVPEYVQPEWAR